MYYGPKMSPTGDGKGLLMSYDRGVYSFFCQTANNCFWKEENYQLKTSRTKHLMMTIPSHFMEDCDLESELFAKIKGKDDYWLESFQHWN